MGLNVYVYTNPLGDFTNGGISSNRRQLVIVNIPGPCEPTDTTPAAYLVGGFLTGSTAILVPAYPLSDGSYLPTPSQDDKGPGHMFGGNYAATSDSRFSDAVAKLSGTNHFHGAVAIHDRVETWDDYRRMSD